MRYAKKRYWAPPGPSRRNSRFSRRARSISRAPCLRHRSGRLCVSAVGLKRRPPGMHQLPLIWPNLAWDCRIKVSSGPAADEQCAPSSPWCRACIPGSQLALLSPSVVCPLAAPGCQGCRPEPGNLADRFAPTILSDYGGAGIKSADCGTIYLPYADRLGSSTQSYGATENPLPVPVGITSRGRA